MGYKSQKKEVMISSEIGKEIIKKELPLIPKLPGVYKMLSDKDQIIYVGKAKNLPNRLKCYESEKNHIIRTERMLSQTGKIEITSQNHGFRIDEKSLPPEVKLTHRSLFDDSLQGLELPSSLAYGFQGHPEASPGPHDIHHVFEKFLKYMRANKNA